MPLQNMFDKTRAKNNKLVCDEHYPYTSIGLFTIHGGRVVSELGCNAINIVGSRPSFGDISGIHFLV